MTTELDALTDREKQTLRLILRGHDAKSAARELALSVHTVNERLREARRKLGVTSSREAARRLLAEETPETPPQIHADKPLGDAPEGGAGAEMTASATRWRAGPRPAAILVEMTAMSLVLAALFLPASPLSVLAPAALIETVAGAEPDPATPSESAGAARAAEAFLKLLDESRWADSYAATDVQFQQLNTLDRWSEISAKVRPPLGALVTRDIIGNEFVPAPPMGYQMVKFRSTYANGSHQNETLSLTREHGAWKVAGIVFE